MFTYHTYIPTILLGKLSEIEKLVYLHEHLEKLD